MNTRLIARPISLALACLTLCSGTAVLAQDANATKTTVKMANGQDQYPDLWEADVFGGIQVYKQVNNGLDMKLSNGGVLGGRFAYNPYEYLGLELWMDYSVANVNFGLSNGSIPVGFPGTGSPVPPYAFGARNWTFGFNPVWNLRPRGSRFQPYLTAGVDGIQFTPTSKAINTANQPNNIFFYHAQGLNDNLQVGFNFGGGFKYHFTDHLGARFDVRGLISRNPTYGLPNAYNGGGVYIPGKDHIDGIQATLGLVLYGGESKCPVMPAAPPPPAPLPSASISGGDGSASGGFCPGKPVTLHASIAAADRKLAYAWTVNGQAQSTTSPDLTFTPTSNSNAQVTVTDTTPLPPPMERPKKFPVRCWVQPPAAAPVAPVSATASVTMATGGATMTSVSASPNALAFNFDGPKTSNLAGIAQAGPCGGNLHYKWTISEGSVTNDTSPNATFDASSLTFEQSSQAQSKSIVATLTVTDDSGKTMSGTANITVEYRPQWVRLDDVIFGKNNTRVNNCGKRLLLEDAVKRMAGGDYDLILVGHRDTDEDVKAMIPGKRKGKGTVGPDLDLARVLNTAAILSGGGGTGTCGPVDVSRIKMDVVGTDQTSESRTGQCGTSNTQERKGSETSEADKNRRVELYLVPHNSTVLPPAVKNARPVPEAEVKALGCPH